MSASRCLPLGSLVSRSTVVGAGGIRGAGLGSSFPSWVVRWFFVYWLRSLCAARAVIPVFRSLTKGSRLGGRSPCSFASGVRWGLFSWRGGQAFGLAAQCVVSPFQPGVTACPGVPSVGLAQYVRKVLPMG